MFDLCTVALDGSTLAERALMSAAALAHSQEGRLRLVQVLPDLVPFECGHDVVEHAWTDHDRAKVVDYLNQAGKNLGLPVEVMTPTGDPVNEILKSAEGSDLLVMTSHGRTGFERLILGSVTEKTIRNAECPVLVVRAQNFQPDQIHRVLVPLDGSQLAEKALPLAQAFAQLNQATIVLARVLDAGQVDQTLPSVLAGRKDYFREIQTYLDQVGEQLDGLDWETHCQVGSPARALLSLSQTHNIDLIVMSTHGHSGLKRWVCGSVAENVLRGSHIPVALVPQKKET